MPSNTSPAIGHSDSLLRYVQTVMVQSAQSTITDVSYRVEGWLTRWLLMCHDQINGDEIALTHHFMGMMISADRSNVTITLHILEAAGLIRLRRDRVISLGRPGTRRPGR